MDFNIESNDFESGEIAREYAIQEALLTALDRAEQQADERQLHRDVVSHTVECCMQSCLSLVEMTFVTREGQPLDPDPLSENSWKSDVEAPPCAPDTWMRGVIQVKKPQQIQLSSAITGDKGMGSQLKGTLKRSGSSRSSQASAAASPRISMDLPRNSSHRSSQPASSRHPAGKATSGAHHASAHKKRPQDSIEERLREEVAIRKKEEQRHAEMLAKEEEDLQKFEALHKQLHGKEYGYDHKGQIVVIHPVDPDHLPPLGAAPTVNTSAGEKKQRQNMAPKPKDSVAEVPKPKSKATLEADGPDFIADKKEMQPPIAESIRLASGITLKTATAVQSGPKRVIDVDHMTKRDHAKYMAKASAENVVTLSGTKGTKGSKVPLESVLDGRLQPQSSLVSKLAGTAAQVSSPVAKPLKQRRQQQQQQAVTSSSVALLTQVPDGEQLKWARDGVPKKIAAKTVDRPPSPVDPNLALLNDSSWGNTSAVKGRSPAQLPVKEAVAADGPMLKQRDRTFKRGQIASIPVAPGLRSDKVMPHVDAYGGSLGWSQ